MKKTNLFSLTAVLGAMLVLGAVQASAQAGVAPSGQLGIGVQIGGPVANIFYALSPSLQLGAGVGFASTDGVSSTALDLHVRWLFEGKVNPLIQAGFEHDAANNGVVSSTSDGAYAGVGLEYFFSRNVGVFGMGTVILLPFGDGAKPTFGVFNPRMGLEWYFDK